MALWTPVQHSQEPVKPNASRLSRPYLGKEEYAHPYVKPHSDKVTRSVSSSQLRNAHHPSSCHDQVTTGNGVPPPKSKSYQSHAVTVDTATSHPPGHKTLGPNSSSLHTLCRDDYSKSTTSKSSDHKVGSQANQSQPKVKLSDIPVKYDITHSHDLPVSHSDKHPLPVCSIFPSKPTVTTTTNLSTKDPMYSSLPFMGETHHENPSPCSLNDLCDEEVHHVPIQDSSHLHLSIMGELHCKYCHVSPYDKDSMVNKDPPCDHFWERTHRTGKPQTKGALQSPPQTSHILEPKDGDYEDSQSLHPDDSVNDTEFQDSLHEFIQSPSIEDNVLRIGDCDPCEMSSHDDDSVPNLSDLFDDNLSSPTDQFQDVIELGQCNIFDLSLAKDFVLTLSECNIFDDLPSDDNCIDLLLAECNIFTEEAPGPSNADNDISQHDDSVPQLGKPVPFPTEDTPTLSETLIPPESGYHSLMDANIVAPALPMNHIFPQPSVACESFSKHFAVNITRCGDADSSTIVPGIQIPLGCESDVSTVSLAPTEVPLLASMPKVRECHPTSKVWESTPSPKAHITSSHDDILGVDPVMGLPHVDLSPIPIPIDIITESPDEVLAPKQTSSLGCPKLVDEDLEDNVHHTSTITGEYISPPTSPLKVHLPLTGAKDLCPDVDINCNFLGFDVNGNYLEVDINGNFIGTDINGNLLGGSPNDNVPPDNHLNWLGLFLMAKGQSQ